jgi:hypothetical protein
MDYEIRIKDRGRREKSLKALKAALASLRLPITIDEVRDEGDELVVDFDIDAEALLRWTILMAFRNNPAGKPFADLLQVGKSRPRKRARVVGKFKADDPKTPKNEAWEGGKAPRKKATPRKRAPAQKKK